MIHRQHASTLRRFIDPETGNRLENPIIPSLDGTERPYTGQIIPAHESTPLGGTGAGLKVFKRYNKDSRTAEGGSWASVTELNEDDHHLVPWATLHTVRTLAGIPYNKKLALQEEISAAAIKNQNQIEDYLSKHGCCAVCRLKPGDIWPFGEKDEVVSARSFFLDHTDDAEPSWLALHGNIKDDLESGKAQVLCFFHNDMKTNGRQGQGTSTTHTNREATKRNVEEKGYMLAASSTDANLEAGLKRSNVYMAKRKA